MWVVIDDHTDVVPSVSPFAQHLALEDPGGTEVPVGSHVHVPTGQPMAFQPGNRDFVQASGAPGQVADFMVAREFLCDKQSLGEKRIRARRSEESRPMAWLA